MPKYLGRSIDGFELVIFPNDHLPKHVHVFKDDGEMKVDLKNLNSLPEVTWDNKAMGKKNSRKAFRLVVEYQAELLNLWDKYHEQE